MEKIAVKYINIIYSFLSNCVSPATPQNCKNFLKYFYWLKLHGVEAFSTQKMKMKSETKNYTFKVFIKFVLIQT